MSEPFNLATYAAEELRAEGAKLFASKQYEEAEEKYTEAILAFGRANFAPGVGVSFTNRSIVCAKLGWWQESYCDAKCATRAFPKFGKAWFRAGVALEKLGVLRAAGSAYYKAVEVDSSLYAVATPAIKRCRLASIEQRQRKMLAIRHGPLSHDSGEEVCPVHDVGENRRIVVGLGPGRCGLHSLAALIETCPEASARCLSVGSHSRHLLWRPSESKRKVASRRLAEMREAFNAVEKLKAVADMNYAWLPYVRDLMELCPQVRFVVMSRDVEAVVESWFNWTEAGSSRLAQNGYMPVHVHAKNHWQWHEQTIFDFDEWDLTLPKYPLEKGEDKRASIRRYVEEYYEQCGKLSVEFPDRFMTFECDELFQSQEKKQDLYRFIGLDLQPPVHVFKVNAQRYQYRYSRGTIEDFLIGDFEAGDDSSDTDDESQRKLALPSTEINEAQGNSVKVVVPDQARPGDTLRIEKKGRAFDVKIPQGKKPGDSFEAPLPEEC